MSYLYLILGEVGKFLIKSELNLGTKFIFFLNKNEICN